MTALEEQGRRAKAAARVLSAVSSKDKDDALEAIASLLWEKRKVWLEANQKDLKSAEENGMKSSMLDRLALNEKRIRDIVDSIRKVISLPDPIGTSDKAVKRPNGLMITKRRVPLGVIAIIYEARPNVTVDAAVLCLKSGNACILRGGKEAFYSNCAVTALMQEALEKAGLPAECVSLVKDTSRESAVELMHLEKYVDVLIPRGGRGLIRSVVKEATVPVIRTGEGICHIYVDSETDLVMASEVLYNAKCSRPSVCNAVECLLVHKEQAEAFLPLAAEKLSEKQVELRLDERSLQILGEGEKRLAAVEEDWDTEYDDLILAVKVVDSMEEAIDFIHEHGTGHSECIMTTNYMNAQYFLDHVDAAAVYVNASTRFTDGGEFGMGAEIGISTQKLHARGPMGLEEMTSIKYVVQGSGQVRI